MTRVQTCALPIYANLNPPCFGSFAGTCYPLPTTPTTQNHATYSSLPTGCTGTATAPAQCDIPPSTTVTLNPGIYYGGLTIRGTAIFTPGVYIIAGSYTQGPNQIAFDMSTGNANSSGGGIMIYSTNDPEPGCTGAACGYGQSSLGNGGAGTGMSASTVTTDYYYGVSFYQDRNNTQPITLVGATSGAFNWAGSIYAPNAQVSVLNNTNFTVGGLLVAKSLTLSGGSNLVVSPLQDVSPTGLRYNVIAWKDF